MATALNDPLLRHRHRYSVDDYYRMADVGILRPDSRVELIEVADSSVGLDRDVKLVRYAYTSVPEVWLVDAKAGTITRYHEPTPNGYRGSEEVQDQNEIPVPGLSNIMLSLQQLS